VRFARPSGVSLNSSTYVNTLRTSLELWLTPSIVASAWLIPPAINLAPRTSSGHTRTFVDQENPTRVVILTEA